MPIYTYHCRECNSTRDYLVSRWGQIPPNGCLDCHASDLVRTFEGQTFACTKTGVRIGEGATIGEGQGFSNKEIRAQTSTELLPGIHITTGVTRDKRNCINVSRVQPNGKVDASVTGYKPS